MTGHDARSLVSVVIPCYNHAAHLNSAVESVLRSTYPAVEVVIVDDGSRDGSICVGRSLAAQHRHVRFMTQENAGPAAARNRGIRLAAGSYILPLDADDSISPDYIEAAVEVLEARPEVKVVYCRAEKTGGASGASGAWKLAPFSRQRLARDNMIFVSALYRKADWAACGGYAEEMTWGYEDWEFWIAMLKEGGEVIQLPLTGFFYRVHPGSRRKRVTRADRRRTVDFLNRCHAAFFHRQIGGPLRYSRTLSRPINLLARWLGRGTR